MLVFLILHCTTKWVHKTPKSDIIIIDMKRKDKDDYITNAEIAANAQEKWDGRFMQVARLIGKWSSCLRPNRQIGAVIVRDKRIVATGYNGAGSGILSCAEKGYCLREKQNIPSGTQHEICYAVHAEQNAIIQAAKLGIAIDNSVLYCTHQPCIICAKMIINSGIKRVVYEEGYPDEFSLQLFEEANVTITRYKSDDEEKNKDID